MPLSPATQERVRAALARAAGAHRSTAILGGLSGLTLSLSALSLLGTVGLALGFDPGAIAVGMGLSTSFITGLVGFGAWRGGSSARRGRDAALAEARLAAATSVLEQSGQETSASSLAQAMGLGGVQADQLMTALNLDDRFTSRVTDEGEIVFSLRDPLRVRIADDLLSEGPPTALSAESAPVVEPPVEISMVEPPSRTAKTQIS
jgi:hypothetical protein